MSKKINLLVAVAALLSIAACTPKEKTSSSVEPTQSSVEPTTSEEPGTSVAPTTSSQAPASSSQAPASSSKTPASSQTPTSSTQPSTEKVFTPAGADIVKENNKVYFKLTGTMTGYKDAEAKLAFGLQHKAAANVGLPDDKDGEWLVGKEAPEAADFKYAPTIDAQGAFEVKIDITDVKFEKGNYVMMVGPQDKYAALSMQQANYGNGAAELNSTKIIFRGDQNLLVAEELPPVHLTEAKISIENEKAFLLVGGELSMAAADFEALDILVTLEKQVGGWSQTKKQGDAVTQTVSGTKGYVKIDLDGIGEGGYQVKIGFDGKGAPNTVMECESYDMRNNPTVLGTVGYAPYFNSTGGNADTLYGCCGLFVTHVHANTRGAQVGTSDLYPITCDCNKLTGYEMDVNTTNAPSVGSDKKMNSNKVATFNVTGIQSGEYEVYFKAHVSAGNETKPLGFSCGDQLTSKGASGGDPIPGRYTVQAGSDEVIYTDTGTKSFADVGIGYSSGFYWTNCAVVPSVMIAEGTTTFKVAHAGAGYSIYLESVRLVRKGNWQPAATNITFNQGKARVEAENFSLKHTIFTNSGEETNYTTDGSTYPVNLDGSVENDATASGGKYVHALFREGWNGSKGSNMSGEVQYRIKLQAATKVKIKAKIKSNMTTEKVCLDLKVDGAAKGTLKSANEWIEVESAEMELAAGVHTIAFIGQQLGSSEGYESVLADIDCFDLVEVAA